MNLNAKICRAFHIDPDQCTYFALEMEPGCLPSITTRHFVRSLDLEEITRTFHLVENSEERAEQEDGSSTT